MPTKKQCSDHSWVLKQLKASQEAEHDMREQSREAHLFVTARDGMWEPQWYERNNGKPRYSFDLCNPIIDQVTGLMDAQDYDIKITPAGGQATNETAEVFDGLVRNIEALSTATSVYSRAGREMVTGGISGWRVKQKYADGNSFDQDLVIERINNYTDRVWHGPHDEPTASDAKMCWVLTGVTEDEFEERYPDRSASASVESDRSATAYFYRRDLVMLGEFLYLQDEERELILMDNGAVYEAGEDFDAVADELAAMGIMEESRRTRKVGKVYSRLFDVNGWISEPKETVFENWIPVIPCYSNFSVIEDKITYWGVIEKLLDPQRVFNYSLSREIEEGALAPRQKYWMTEAQAEGYEKTLATLNTNTDPVQFFNPDPELPGPPQQIGGAMINPGLRNISESMRDIVGQSIGMFAANMGDNPGLQSGVAIENLQARGDSGNNKYIEAMEEAQGHTGRILVNAIPRVYTPGRMVRLLKEDGSFEMQTIAQEVMDQQTGQKVVLNDLSVGTYDVTCSAGPSFNSRQSETVTALTEVGKIDPSVIEMGGDILMGNIPSPGMDKIAQRKRQQLFKAGFIPQDQMTDDELQQLQQMQQQPPQEDPNMVLARAEEQKAVADQMDAQNKKAQIALDARDKEQQREIDRFAAETDRFKAEIERAKALAEVRGKAAAAAKALSEAEAQDIENDMVMSGVMQMVKGDKSGY